MDNTLVPLDPPAAQTIVNIINNFSVSVSNVILGTSATMYVRLYHDDTFIVSAYYTITGSEYAAWGSDDQYIINLTANWIRQNYH